MFRSTMTSVRTLLMATLLVVTASANTGCSVNPATGRRQISLVSSNQVAAMGAAAAPEMVTEFGGEVRSPELRQYVNEVGERVARQVEPEYADVQWTFYVLESDVINAFALPGGNVFVTRGLLSRFENEAQLAGVLGHEIGHVTGRHVDERLSQSLIAEFGMQILGASTESAVLAQGAQMAAQGALLKFGRDQESESDALGLKYMVRAGYDPIGLYQVLEILKNAAEGPRPPEILSTHPDPARRMRDVEVELRGPYRETQGSADYGIYAGRYQRRAWPYVR